MVLKTGFIGILLFSLASCGGSTKKEKIVHDENYIPDGELLFMNNCASCHGIDGKLGVSGALDLSKSTLTHEEISSTVLKGRAGMPPFDYLFKDKRELDAVSDHIISLRK